MSPFPFLLLLLILLPIVYLWPVMDLPYTLAKGLHVAGMAVIAVLVCRLEWGVWKRGLLLVGIFIAAAFMEGLQYAMPGRQGAVVDVVFNGVGCVVGVAGYWVVVRLFPAMPMKLLYDEQDKVEPAQDVTQPVPRPGLMSRFHG